MSKPHSIRAALLALAATSLPGSSALAAEQQSAAPTIEHEPVASFTRGVTVTVTAKIRSSGSAAIFEPQVLIRSEGMERFARVPMQPVPGAASQYSATLPETFTRGDFEYYVEAFDEEGNGPSRKGTPQEPLHAKALEPAPAAPALATPASPLVPEAAPATQAATQAPRSSPRKIAGICTVGAGGALIAGALVFGGLALSAKGDMEHSPTNAAYDRAKNRAESRALVANILAGAGLAAAGTGAVLWATSPAGSPAGGARTVAVSAVATPAGGALLIVGRY